MSEHVRQARAGGRRIIGLSSGDPNLANDQRIIAAAERALRGGDTHYAAPAGRPALREAIARLPGSAFGRSGAGYLGDAELDEALGRVARIGVVS
jgi:aspartate aminotransferase